MATFVYSPAIRVHIESQDNGTIDVSGDIANWNLTRRSNAVSSFSFVLQNAQRKYDGIFRPSDRITVELKRITWVRVFTGTLNNTPIFSVWPRALPMSASCSLKKLQFWPWDPTTTAATNLFQNFVTSTNTQTSGVGDGGLSKLATEAMVQVTNWDRKAIHFGQVPNTWFKWAEETETLINRAASMQAILGSNATVAGNQVGSIPFPAGNYNGVTLNDTQAGNVASIYAVILGQTGLSTAPLQDRALLIAIMTAMQESTLQVLDHGDRDSVGLYQQRPSQGWGTKAECMDITHSTKAFITHLLKVPSWNTIDPGQAAQSVQGSAYPDAYNTWLNFANTAVTAAREVYQKALKSGANNTVNSADSAAAGLPSGTMPKTGTGTAMASVALDLIKSRPAGSILYSQDGVSDPQSTAPTVLDCSALVQWVYYHTTGSLLNHRRSEDQYALCKTAGGAIIPVELAAKIQGALVFVVNPATDDAHHVGVSLGDNTHVAAHTDGIPPAKQVTAGDPIIGEFTTGGLLPGIDYTNAAIDAASAAQLQQILKKPTTVSKVTVGSGADPSITTGGTSTTPGTSVIDQLINVVVNPAAAAGTIFGGPRQLIHNQTFLPWLQTITNSSMRSFCSAPNGDFIAWFPDYFGIWGTAASMNIELIELQDFTAEWSDQQIVTHEFVIGSVPAVLDASSGGIQNGADSSYQGLVAMQNTKGIATMDYPEIFKAIYGTVPGKNFASAYLQRFGARPNLDQMSNIRAGDQEFYMALWNFMFYWAAQFSAEVPMTFMPELYPGMLLKIPACDFQGYVTEVEHSGSYGQSGGFTTKATIVAPSRLDKTARTDLFGMLPIAGGR